MLSILSDIMEFTFTYTLSLIILVLGKTSSHFINFLIASSLVYLFALGFILRSVDKVRKAFRLNLDKKKILDNIPCLKRY